MTAAKTAQATVGNHLHVDTLGYADDVSLISERTEKMTERVTSISEGSKEEAYMKINIKT